MLIDDILHDQFNSLNFDNSIIRTECSRFLKESNGLPLYNTLPNTYSDFHRVKARFRKQQNIVSNHFNKAFEHNTPNLRQRATFAYSYPMSESSELDLFYVFPIDTYKFLYSKEVKNSNNDYKQIMETLLETCNNMETASDIITEMLKYTYNTTNLYEGLLAQTEIIFYNIPYYYAVRVNSGYSYKQIIP